MSDSARSAGPAVQLPDESEASESLLAKVVAVAGAAVLAVMLAAGMTPPVAAFLLLFIILPVILLDPRVGIMATFAFLAVTGDFRRLLLHGSGSSLDPVLLVVPTALVLLVGIAFAKGRLAGRSKLSRLVLVLTVVMVLEVFNPLQGGLAVGLGGAMFFLIPLTWFWVGKAWGTESFTEKLLFRVIVPVAIAAGVFGLCQACFGLPRYQWEWLTEQYGTTPLKMGVNYRPFSFFTSTAEFTEFLAMALVLPLASLFAKRFRLSVLLFPLLALALFMSGCRGPLVAALAAMIALWAMLSRNVATAVLRLFLAVVCVVLGMTWALSQLTQVATQNGDTSALVKHQAEGLLDPGHSTAGVHGDLIRLGFLDGLRNPVGSGLGSTTLAATKFGGAGASSEFDVSDMFMSMGLLGGIPYLLLVFQIVRIAWTYWRAERRAVGLVVAGLLAVGVGRWLLGQSYSTAALTWFCVGALDRITTTLATRATSAMAGPAALKPAGRRHRSIRGPRSTSGVLDGRGLLTPVAPTSDPQTERAPFQPLREIRHRPV